jgi:hypothetical protein
MSSLPYELAYDAIEEWVRERWPGDQGKWQEIVPSGPRWGYSREGWQVATSVIVNNYRRRLPHGQSIFVSQTAKENLRGKMMIEFQGYLAAKSTALSAAIIIQAVE